MAVTTLLAKTVFDATGDEFIRDGFVQIEDGTIKAVGRRIPTALIFRAMAVIAIMFVAHFVATLGVVISEHLTGGDVPFIDILFETMSAIATVGVTTGITPALSDPAKLVLCATMMFGRLGPLTAVYALQLRQHVVRYKFPEAPIRIG